VSFIIYPIAGYSKKVMVRLYHKLTFLNIEQKGISLPGMDNLGKWFQGKAK